jgi:hypothetical protein
MKSFVQNLSRLSRVFWAIKEANLKLQILPSQFLEIKLLILMTNSYIKKKMQHDPCVEHFSLWIFHFLSLSLTCDEIPLYLSSLYWVVAVLIAICQMKSLAVVLILTAILITESAGIEKICNKFFSAKKKIFPQNCV